MYSRNITSLQKSPNHAILHYMDKPGKHNAEVSQPDVEKDTEWSLSYVG